MEFRAGPTMDIRWVDSGGTLALVAQYRNLTKNDEADMLDSSAGTVTFREFIAGLRQWNVDYEGLNNGTDTPLGTADIVRLAPQTRGTIIISEFGTASGNFRILGEALIQSANNEWPYDDVASSNISWQGSGPLTQGVWA